MPEETKKKAKKVTEKVIETAILTYLNYLPQCFAWKNNNTGIYDPKRGCFRKNRNKFAINGVADIIGVYRGRMLAIEVKKPGGKATKEQTDFINRINKLGGIAGVATSIDDVRQIIRKDGGFNEHNTKELSE